MIRGRSRARVEVALAHNESRCVTRAYDPYVVASVRHRKVAGITRSQGRWATGRMRSKAIGLPGFPFIYQAARVPRTRCTAGIASTHHLKAVAHACEAWTGIGTLAGTSGHDLAVGRSGLGWPRMTCSPGSFNIPDPNSVVTEHITTCAKLDVFAGQTGNLTRQLRITL